MDKGIHIGSEVNKAAAEAVSTGIIHILRAGFECHSDQDTIRCALLQFAASMKVENVTIQNCHIDGKTVNT